MTARMKRELIIKPVPVPKHTMQHGGAGIVMAGAREADENLIKVCGEAITAVETWLTKPGAEGAESYDRLFGRLRVLLTVAQRAPATSDAGLRAKAEVVRELLGPGICAQEAGRLAISLANDLLGRA